MNGGESVVLGRKAPGMDLSDCGQQIDMVRLRGYRLSRLRQQLRRLDCAGIVLFDPINIRYATGSRNMTVWCLHNAARYCFVSTEGPVVLFDYHNTEHLSDHLETVDEIRPALTWFYFASGNRTLERAQRWAGEIADLVSAHGGGNRRLAADHCDPIGAAALEDLDIELIDGQAATEHARSVKSMDEIGCMSAAISVCEAGMARMREELRPGITENQLWAKLHEANIAGGGEWIETRLLTSGGKTNPWFQECGDRVIRAGELVGFDTDLIGPFGYCADISRTYFCEPGRPSEEQRRLYGLAHEQIHYNMELLRPGLRFSELAAMAWQIPEAYWQRRYSTLVHGVGLADEYPFIGHSDEYSSQGLAYDGEIEAGMTLCVESYIGAEDGSEGVKLEQQILVTDRGCELLSTFPFEDILLEG